MGVFTATSSIDKGGKETRWIMLNVVEAKDDTVGRFSATLESLGQYPARKLRLGLLFADCATVLRVGRDIIDQLKAQIERIEVSLS
jgi:hypothetical protein